VLDVDRAIVFHDGVMQLIIVHTKPNSWGTCNSCALLKEYFTLMSIKAYMEKTNSGMSKPQRSTDASHAAWIDMRLRK